MKKFLKYLKIFITVGILLYFVWYFYKNQEDFLLVLSTDRKYILALFFLNSLSFLLNGIFIKVILERFKKTITVGESFYISVISSLGNYFLPMRGGAVIRSVYLKKKFDFSYSHFVSTLYGNYIIVFLVNAFVALLSLIVIQLNTEVISYPLYIFFGALFVGMLILSTFEIPIYRIKDTKLVFVNKIKKIITDILNGWNIIISDRKLLLSLILLTFGNFIFMTIIFWIEFLALNIETTLVSVILYNCISGVSLLVSLTPGSLGIREGLFIITSDILGISNSEVLQLALLDRSVIVISLVLLFTVFYIVRLSIKIKNKKVDETK